MDPKRVPERVDAELSPPLVDESHPLLVVLEQLRSFLGLTGYLRYCVKDYGIIAALLTNLLGSNAFASKFASKMPVEWGGETSEGPQSHQTRSS